MPKIFEYFGFIFYFFSNEHEPIHVHGKDEKVAIEFINKYWQRIVEKWIDFFVMKKVVKTTYIKEKL